METIVTNQSELDSIPTDFNGVIKITGDVYEIKEKYSNATIEVCEKAQIVNIHGNAQSLKIYGIAQVVNVYGKFPECSISENGELVNLYGECPTINIFDNGILVNNKSF